MAGLSARALAAMGQAARGRAGALLGPLVAALTGPADQVDTLVTTPPGPHRAPPLLDLATTPYPAWLGQAAGLAVPASLSAEVARAYVAGRGVSKRGTPGALIAAARSALSGGAGIVRLAERVGGDAYAATLTTYAAQTPDPGAVLRSAQAEKPVGLVLSHVVLPGQTWGDVARSGTTFAQLRTLTVRQLREAAPDA